MFNVTPSDFIPKKDALYSLLHTNEKDREKRIDNIGITTKDGVHFTCWAGCFTNADIIDIIGLETGATDYNSKLEDAAAEYNITIEGLSLIHI